MISNYNLSFCYIIIFTCMLVSSCKQTQIEKPIPSVPLTTVYWPLEETTFIASSGDWEATLFTFTQPIAIDLTYTHSGFVLSQDSPEGIVEGPVKICLKNGKHLFYYDAWLKNRKHASIESIDLRSPKTVNPDSSLYQQRIAFEIDEWSNVVRSNHDDQLFQEEEILLLPVAGIYRAQEHRPLSAFEVQSGSCVSIPIKTSLSKEGKYVLVKVGPLYDEHQNLIADGTVINLICDDGQFTYRTETALISGFAESEIPIERNRDYQINARVHTTHSRTIQFNTRS